MIPSCGLCMRRECRERFPYHQLQRKPLVSNPGMHHGTCVTCVPWCMSGFLNRSDREYVPGIRGACATRNFITYLARGWCHVNSGGRSSCHNYLILKETPTGEWPRTLALSTKLLLSIVMSPQSNPHFIDGMMKCVHFITKFCLLKNILLKIIFVMDFTGNFVKYWKTCGWIMQCISALLWSEDECLKQGWASSIYSSSVISISQCIGIINCFCYYIFIDV